MLKEKELKGTEDQHMEDDPSTKELHVSPDGLVSIDQIRQIILGTIKDKFEKRSKLSFTYIKPYTKIIDILKMPTCYHLPNFNNLMAKVIQSNILLAFVETCNNMVLKGIT